MKSNILSFSSSVLPQYIDERKNVVRLRLCWVLFALATATASYAQINTGSIIGRVTDASGASVVNAKVTLANLQTGIKVETNVNETGDYAFRGLEPGTYKITAVAPGFDTLEETNIQVAVAETNTHDVQLTVGATSTAVTVTANTVALETGSATLGTLVEQKEVNDLPLNGRNFTELLLITAGVTSAGTDSQWGNPQSGDYRQPSINGQSQNTSTYLLDGTNNTSNFTFGPSVSPVIDDIAEFKVVSNADSVEYSGGLGGYINVVTKGGTNQFHGNVWEFLRNNDLDARDPFLPNVNPLKQNQFGGDVGGPVRLPHYDGRNRTFFFGSYQGFRQSIGSTALYEVPTLAMYTGDFTGQPQIYNPWSTRPDPNNPGSFLRDPFECDAGGNPITPNANKTQTGGTPCNKIPTSLFDASTLAYAQTLFPKPINTGVPGTNGIDPTPAEFNQNQFFGRGDEQIGPHSISVRYNHFTSPDNFSGGIAGSTQGRDSYGWTLGANYTYTITPATVFHMLFSRTYVNLNLFSKWDNLNYDSFVPQYWPWNCHLPPGIGGRPAGYGTDSCWAPLMSIPGYPNVNQYNSQVGQTDLYEFKPTITHVHGNHTTDAGFTLSRHLIWAGTQRGFIDFSNTQTANLENVGSTGSGIASFFLGIPSGGNLTDSTGYQTPDWVYGGFVHDQWKASDRLTVNYGVRWDAFKIGQYGVPGNPNYYAGAMDPLRGTYIIPANPGACSVVGQAPCIPTPNGVLPDHVVIAQNGHIFRNVYDNWQPRVGLAYRVGDKTVLRAGYGRYFDQYNGVDSALFQSQGLWPDNNSITNTGLNTTYVTTYAENPLNITPGEKTLPDPNGPFDISTLWRDPRMKNAFADEWSAGVERELTQSQLLTVNYVGERGMRIPIGGDIGNAVTPGPGNPLLRENFPYIPEGTALARDWGRNWYEALQATFQRRFSNGLSYTVAYTWSKAEDFGGAQDWSSGEPQDPYDLWMDKGVGALDIPQVLSGGLTYNLPFGKGHYLDSGNAAANAIIGGWQINSILQITSGLPYGPILCGDIANVNRSTCYERPNLVGNPNLANPSPAQWFNPSAFAVPADYTFGNEGVNTLRSDGLRNLDLSLFRNIALGEKRSLQFRFEAFNSLNSVSWGVPVSQLELPGQTGAVFGTRSTEREIQIALKLYF
ncbi:MAG TPA: carboxypeptidase regulatory-like domain-containing protein [Terriglobia bacterium]|nr:carboxypeptidase regulatory-like domain-containing protein [Terriglobia bacterium]